MVNDQEQYEILKMLNQARQALGKQVDMSNTLAMSSDLTEIERCAKQFPELDFQNWERAISEALISARRILSEGNFKLWDININPVPEIRQQLNLIQQALNAAKIDNAPRLTEPKPPMLSGPEWLAQEFANFYESGRYTGTFAPIWAKNIFGDDLPQLTALNRALAVHPDFHKGAQEIARKECASMFISKIYSTAKADGIHAAKMWHEPGQTFQDIIKPGLLPNDPPIRTSPERDALTAKIDEHNATSITKFSFKVESEWLRCRAMAAIHAYARLVLPPEAKPQTKPISKSTLIANLEDIKE